MAKPKMKAPITMAAIRQRLRRKLLKQGDHGQVLKVNRSYPNSNGLGEFYLVDIDGNHVLDADVDVVALAKRMGVLKPYEQVV